MVMIDDTFKTRKVSRVRLTEIELFPTSKNALASAVLTIQMATQDGGAFGPEVRLQIGVDISDESNMKALQLELLAYGLSLLRRIADETPESLREILVRTSDEAQD
jgi:hypothetical protein